MLHDHIDLRVTDLATTRPLYDALLPALGYTRVTGDATCVYYHLPGRDIDFFGINEDPAHNANGSRIAFAAKSNHHVNELTELARAAGAKALEGPQLWPEYSERYYAAFFEDASGNQLEICCRDSI